MAIISHTDIYRIFHSLVNQSTGLDVTSIRPFYDSSSKEARGEDINLCFINVSFEKTVGTDNSIFSEYSEDLLKETVVFDRIYTLSINFTGNNSGDNSSKFRAFLQSQVSTQFLNSNDIGFINSSQIRDLSIHINGAFEKRRQLDVSINVRSEFDAGTVGYFEEAQISGETITPSNPFNLE